MAQKNCLLYLASIFALKLNLKNTQKKIKCFKEKLTELFYEREFYCIRPSVLLRDIIIWVSQRKLPKNQENEAFSMQFGG